MAMANLAVASSPTTYWQLCGSATSTVRVTKITIAGRQTVAANADIPLIKTSNGQLPAAPSLPDSLSLLLLWSASLMTLEPAAAGTAPVTAWTANPTVGTPLRHFRRLRGVWAGWVR